jgi:hypothetical protein
MKRSELKLTGETYRLTPSKWGETYIMVDEDEVSRVTAEAFDIPIDDCDPDNDPNDRPESVDIATGPDGKYYAILHPYEATSWGHKTGEIHNKNLYRECQNPAEAVDGGSELYGQTWELFDDEED